MQHAGSSVAACKLLLWPGGSRYLTRDQTQALCLGSAVLTIGPPGGPYPHFFKVCFTLLHIYDIPTLVPGFANAKKSEEVFFLLLQKKKRQNVKTAFSVCFATSCTEVAYTQSSLNAIVMLLYRKLHSASGHHSYELCL